MATKSKESKQIQKARAKLAAQLEKDTEQITPEAIKKTATQIQGWIARHASERISLQDKGIELFDENKSSARTTSAHIRDLRTHLESEIQRSNATMEQLKGRIKVAKQMEVPSPTISREGQKLNDVIDDLHNI
ncbi:MAG: hypothetical protein CMO81_03970 [Waddliaceae bacterium]|nr:hypothetical protein [Waddliaceae bacterium]